MAENEFGPGTKKSARLESLVQAARDGSAASFGELTERCRRYLLHVARHDLMSAELRAKVSPSDLVQETLVLAQRMMGSFRGETEGEFQAWLRKILFNQACGAARHFLGTAKRDMRREVALEATDPNALVEDVETPSKQVIAKERMQAMAASMQRLPPLYRQVIQLRSLELRSFTDIGQQLSRSPEAVRSLWVRAVERLRTEIEASNDTS